MKHFIQMVIAWVLIPVAFWTAIAGCAGLLPFAAKVSSCAVTAGDLLHTLDTVYGKWLALKDDPEMRAQATKVLALADETAKQLRAIKDGAKVDDAQLNALAGAVEMIQEGAK